MSTAKPPKQLVLEFDKCSERFPVDFKEALDAYFHNSRGLDQLLVPSNHYQVRKQNDNSFEECKKLNVESAARGTFCYQYFTPLRKDPYTIMDSTKLPEGYFFPQSVKLVDKSGISYAFDISDNSYIPLVEGKTAWNYSRPKKYPITSGTSTTSTGWQVPYYGTNNFNSTTSSSTITTNFTADYYMSAVPHYNFLCCTPDYIAITSKPSSFCIDMLITSRLFVLPNRDDINMMNSAKRKRHHFHLCFKYDKQTGIVILDLKESFISFKNKQNKKIILYFQFNNQDYLRTYLYRFFHSSLSYHNCASSLQWKASSDILFDQMIGATRSHVPLQISDLLKYFKETIRLIYLRVIQNNQPYLKKFVKEKCLLDTDTGGYRDNFCGLLTYHYTKHLIKSSKERTFYNDIFRGEVIPYNLGDSNTGLAWQIAQKTGKIDSLSNYIRQYIPSFSLTNLLADYAFRNRLKDQGIENISHFMNSYGLTKTIQIFSSHSFLKLTRSETLEKISIPGILPHLPFDEKVALDNLKLFKPYAYPYLTQLFLNTAIFYSEVHKYHSHEAAFIDEIYPPLRLISVLTSNVSYGGQIALLNLPTFPLQDWIQFANAVDHHFSHQKMRRFFHEIFAWEMYGTAYSEDKLTAMYGEAHAHIKTTPNFSMYLRDMSSMLRNIKSKYVEPGEFKDSIPWKNLTTAKEAHDEIVRAYNRVKYANIPCKNVYYQGLEDVDLTVPDLQDGRYKIVFAPDTHTVRDWGTAQRHCISNYAEYINRKEYIVFGVWDNQKEEWFGHCINNVQLPSLKKAKTSISKINSGDSCIETMAEFIFKTMPTYTEWQFYGHSNKSLDRELKKKMMDFVMEIVFRRSIQKEEAKEQIEERELLPVG